MIKMKIVAGPNPYVGGTGIQVTFGEFERITKLIVMCSNTDSLAVNDTAYAVHASFTGVTATALVFSLVTTGAGNIWTELAAGNMLALRFIFIAEGE